MKTIRYHIKQKHNVDELRESIAYLRMEMEHIVLTFDDAKQSAVVDKVRDIATNAIERTVDIAVNSQCYYAVSSPGKLRIIE